MAELKEGSLAPDFMLPDTLGGDFQLSDYRGHKVVLFFYPKDDTPGCTIEAQQFTKFYNDFHKQDVVVCGISFDDIECHKDFIDKYDLQVELLADTEGEVAKLYNSNGNGHALRKTFLIAQDGTIKKIFENVNPDGHAEEVLNALSKL